MSCAACKGPCPTPQACELPVAIATKPPRVAFLLDGAFERAPGRTMVAVCCVLLALLGLAGKADQLADESVEIHAEADDEVQP